MKKIVLVDDINYHLLSIKERLKNSYEVFPAKSAEILFGILNNVIPDLILLDINMPEINGFETMKKLKANPRFANIPVIFFTGKKDRSDLIKGMSLGAVDFITKPISTEDLIKNIENQLNPDKRGQVKPVILAIDDSPSILEGVNIALQDRYNVYTLPRPEAIQEVLKKVTPDLFLLDYQMPVLTGFDLVPIIRKIPVHEKTPIVFLTSEGTVDHLSVAVAIGACDFIVKPINPDLLRERIAANLVDFKIWRRIRSLE